MRLRMIGVALVATGLTWLTCADALANAPRASSPSAGSTEDLLPPATTFASGDLARFQLDMMRPLEDRESAHPIHLAAATPLVRERGSSQAQAVIAAASFVSSPPEQPPSAWLMVSVIVLLIGYQLRRKHRLLRPHRFHRI